MKTTKKALSVLLAVIMVMSSVSVCFGSITFAATDAVNDFVAAVQCDVMKNFTAPTGTQTGTMKNSSSEITRSYSYAVTTYKDYTDMVDVLEKFDAAWRSLYNNTALTHSNSANCANKQDWCIDAADVLAALQADIGASTYNTLNSTYHLGDLLGCILSMEGVSHRNETNDSHSALRTCTCNPGVYNKFTVSISMLNYLKSFTDAAAIDSDSLSLSHTYTFAMSRQNYDTGSIIKTRHHHLAVNTLSRDSLTEASAETATNKATLTAMKSALESNKAYLSKTTIAGIHEVSTDPSALNGAAQAIEDAYEAVNSTFGTNAATLYNHFFSANYIDHGTETTNLVALLKKAAVIAGYKSSCDAIDANYALYANETYKTYTSTEVNELYNKLKTAYEGFKAADDTLESEIAAYYGIDDIIGYVPAAIDALLAYYYEIFLGSIDERAFGKDGNPGYVNVYQNWTVEDIDNDVVTSADILTALSEVTLDIDTITSDATDADIQGYFDMSKAELIDMLTVVKTYLEYLGYYAGLNDELYDQYNTFTNNIVNVINADSSRLYGVLNSYEQWHKDLQSFFTTWSAEVGEYRDLLEDDLQAAMNAYMKEAYAALKARVVTQIDNAYGLYEVYNDMYGNNVTMASLTYFNTLKRSIDSIEHDAYRWMLLNHETYGEKIDAESIRKYDALQVIYGAYGTFVANRGFDNYTQTPVDTVREDTDKDIARENADVDGDGIGEYEVKDADVEKVIDALEAALADDEIKALLGSLINKDEDGNPTGEPFDLAALINNLLEGIYSDDVVNGIVQMLYPIVAKAFLDVWEGIDPIIWIYDMETGMSIAPTADVKVILELYDVDTAVYEAGLAISPAKLAEKLASNPEYAAKYSSVIADLGAVTAKTRYNADGEYVDPWQDAGLFMDVINEETGETKQACKLDWGIDEAVDKKAAFIDAVSAALSGLEPLLYALVLNQPYSNGNESDPLPRGNQIGTGFGDAAASGLGAILGSMVVTVDPITLVLEISGNKGYDNVLAPIFEALGLTNIPKSEDMRNTKEFLEKGLFGMIDQLISKVAANPIETILDVIPNLVYAFEADLVAPLLNFLAIDINYYADAYYSAKKGSTTITSGNLDKALKSDEPISINVGEMIDLESMGVNLSGGLAGLLELIGIEIPMPNVSVLATAGELTWIDSNRTRKSYEYGGDKAAHIVADRADILEYLVKYALGNLNELLTVFGVDTSTFDETVAALLDNLAKNPDDVVAAVVELLNLKHYNTLENYEWFNPDTYALPTIEGFNPATQLYMNPGNDWTEEKAEYLYNNLETILTTIFTMAGVEVNIEQSIADGVNGLFTNKTVTDLAKLLANLDLNALLAGDKAEEAAEGEEAATPAIDINALVKDLLGIDLTVFAQYKDIADDYDWGVTDADSFVTALVNLLDPLSDVLDFILAGGNLTITLGNETVSLPGYDGYNNAFVPLLEALGCDVKATAEVDNKLEAVLKALVAKINALTVNDPAVEKDGAIYTIIDTLPGVVYFLSSNGVSTSVRNLLQPVYVILDTIRPVYDVNIDELIAGIEVDFDKDGVKSPLGLDLNNISTEFVIGLVCDLTGLNLTGLNTVIYDVCKFIGVDYTDTAKSTLAGQTVWMKGSYTDEFTQADMLTVILSYVLEWATVKENAEALDALLKTDGIIASLNAVFADVEITYGTPDWYYWFESQEEFDAYLATGEGLPNTLAMLTYPNDWSEESAQYLADNLSTLVDTVIGLVNKDKEDAAKTVSELLAGLLNGYLTADSLNQLVDLIAGLLEQVDANLIEAAGRLLDVDLNGLKAYEAPEIVATEDQTLTEAFAAELANVLTTYADRLMNWLFFGDDYRFAKKSDNTDTIVINGGLGYEKGLALVLEALGCDAPAADEATVANVLAALAARVDEILADPVNEALDLLPNLVYFLNANGAGVAVDNILQPVYALLTKLEAFGVKLDLAGLIGFDLKYLSLADIIALVKDKTGLDLSAAEGILVDLCIGKIEKATYTYKMTADRKDTLTVLLTTALVLVEDEEFAAKLDEMLGTDVVSAIRTVFESVPVTYVTPDWDYCWAEDGIDYDNHTVDIIEKAIEYPNDWTEEKSEYLADNLSTLVDMVVALASDEDSLADLLKKNVNVFTTENLQSLIDLIADLLKDVDDELLGVGVILDADIVGLMNHKVKAGITTVDEFAAEFANILNKYASGVIEWLLLGEDLEFFVDDANADGRYGEGEDIIVINGAHGYAEGLALVLEALGCKNLPDVYAGEYTTEEIVEGVFASLAARINEIFANPVDEVIDLLPNLIYFLNTNGVAAAVTNLTGAINAVVTKLEAFGVKLDINELVNLKKLMKIEDTDATISLSNLAMKDILQAVSYMTGLDLSKAEDVLVGFALGEVNIYESISRTDTTYKMEYKDEFDKHDMITVLVTTVLLVVFETEGNAEKLNEMINTDILTAIKAVFEEGTVVYTVPDWDYPLNENGTVDAMKYSITYPNNWTEATAEYLADNLPEIGDMIAGLIDSNYATLSDLLKDKVNVFTSANLQSIVDSLAGLLKDIDEGLLEAAGVLLDVDVAGLKSYKVKDGITTVDAFADELAYILNTFAPGVVEWLLLGEDYRFFVKDVDKATGIHTDYIVINGAHGYAEGLALLLEALGCENLPDVYENEYTTEEVVNAVLGSLAARINEIFENPVEEIVDLLPNLIYFLNTNGVAAVVDNVTAAITTLVARLESFGIKLDLNELVNIRKLMKIEDTDATISLDNLAMKDILQAVSYMTDFDITYVEDVLVGFALGQVNAYDSVSVECAPAKKMTYKDEFDKHDMLTVVANLALITLTDEENEKLVKDLLGEDVYNIIIGLIDMEEIPVQAFSWKLIDKADTGYVFSALSTSDLYDGHKYGPLYTEEMAKYIGDNFGDFVDNIVYLLGIEINGKNVDTLKDLINGLINGSVYNSQNVIAIRDALVGILNGIGDLEVKGQNVGGHIKTVLKVAEIADLDAVAKVEIPEFSEDRAQFVTSLCDVIEPLYPVLKWLLADEDISFFVDTDKSDLITLKGGEGYAYGIIPLLETLECEGILTPDEYYAAVEAEGDVLLTSILNPLLDRVDVIMENPADEILNMLPNIIYFINSNGVDTVVKNTLNAVYALLRVIEPIAKVDLYEVIGIDLAAIDFEWLFDKLLEIIADATGYEFSALDANAIVELTVGELKSYTSKNGLTAYKMVYANTDDISGGRGEMATVVMRLLITFIMHENNREALIGLLKDNLGMSADAEKYVRGILDTMAAVSTETYLGMDKSLATLYYLFYGADIAVGETSNGLKDINAQWQQILKDLGMSDDPNEKTVGNLLAQFLDKYMEDVLTSEGVAPNGFIAFFQKIADFFQKIMDFFKNLFS